jgi:hypothetical protein
MRAREIRKGDEFEQEGEIVYVVTDVEHLQREVRATVRFRDGGLASRVWDVGTDVPLTRPPHN